MYMYLTTLYRQILRRIARDIEPDKYFMFRLDMSRLTYEDIEKTFNENGYYYNDLSIRFKNQLYTCRKIVGDDQIHLRLYEDGWVSGHYELASFHGSDHLRGVNYRILCDDEIEDAVNLFHDSLILEMWRGNTFVSEYDTHE